MCVYINYIIKLEVLYTFLHMLLAAITNWNVRSD